MKSVRRAHAAHLLLLATILGSASGSCRSPASPESETPAPGCAQCPVCRCEGDLACVNVRIRSDTPTCCYCGCTFYFCSEECKRDFERKPRTYVGSSGAR